MSIRKQAAISSWISKDEQRSVGRGLRFSCAPHNSDSRDDDDGQVVPTPEQALEMVSVWKVRSSGERLPHAIESTASLAQVQYRDFNHGGGGVMSTSTELRLAYSSAITRCINGFADAMQQQRSTAAPVSALCGQIGIPVWLVDVRHEASHNTLPTLPVLRMAATTMLEFLYDQYWLPACLEAGKSCSNGDSAAVAVAANGNAKITAKNAQPSQSTGTAYLLKYKAAMTAGNAERTVSSEGTHSKKRQQQQQQNRPTKNGPSGKRKGRPQAMNRGIFSTSDDDEDASNESDGFSSSADDDWTDPLFGTLWGHNIGTASNRFSALSANPSKKNKKKSKAAKNNKQRKKTEANSKRRKLSGPSPMDHIRSFLRSTPMDEAYDSLLKFLVWGGIGSGAPIGRGHLVPGSVTAFPASEVGIVKVIERYNPLIVVVCRQWPGFLHALLINIVDCVIAFERSPSSSTSSPIASSVATPAIIDFREDHIDLGRQRKLYFLLAWFQYLMSQRCIQSIRSSTKLKFATGKKSDDSRSNGNASTISTERLKSASWDELRQLQIPLNSLCDMLVDHVERIEPKKDRRTSKKILALVGEILGIHRIRHNGLPGSGADGGVVMDVVTGTPTTSSTSKGEPRTPKSPASDDTAMSLDALEAMLARGSDNGNGDSGNDDAGNDDAGNDDDHCDHQALMETNAKYMHDASEQRQTSRMESMSSMVTNTTDAWTLCRAWDPCAIGTMPGRAI